MAVVAPEKSRVFFRILAPWAVSTCSGMTDTSSHSPSSHKGS